MAEMISTRCSKCKTKFFLMDGQGDCPSCNPKPPEMPEEKPKAKAKGKARAKKAKSIQEELDAMPDCVAYNPE